MEIVKVCGSRLVSEEKEVYLYLDPIDRVWVMDAFLPKYFRKAIKQGWTPIKEYIYEDGTVYGMSFTAPERAISIRNIEKKKLSEKQREKLGLVEE